MGENRGWVSIVGVLPGRICGLVTTNRIIREPVDIIGRVIRGSVSTNTGRMALRVGGNNAACVHVASSNDKVSHSSIHGIFVSRTASGVTGDSSLGSVNALNFENRTVTSVTTITEIRVLAGAHRSRVNAHCRVYNNRRGSLSPTNYPTNAAVIIHSVFCGIPTEVGFLGGSMARNGTIRNIISEVTLSRPRVSFHFVHRNGRIVLASNGNSLGNAICSIFNSRLSSALVPISCSFGSVHVANFISEPRRSEGDHTVRFFFVGKELIGDNATVTTLRRTCGGSVVINECPTYILGVRVSAGLISIGIRPTGARIQFIGRHPIFSLICCNIGATVRAGGDVGRTTFCSSRDNEGCEGLRGDSTGVSFNIGPTRPTRVGFDATHSTSGGNS